ncbi:hypothetical protein [Lysobacter gummosus]
MGRSARVTPGRGVSVPLMGADKKARSLSSAPSHRFSGYGG